MHRPHPLERVYGRYERTSALIGLTGNVLFLAGSLVFALDLAPSGPLFVAGSAGMLVRSAARVYVDRRMNADPEQPSPW